MSDLSKLYDVINTYDCALLTTISDGRLVCRPMTVQKPPLPDSDLWFVAAFDSSMVRDIQADSRVNLGFFHEKGNRAYVSVSGTAHIEQNRQRIEELWQDSWRVYFPNGMDDPELCLIHVKIELAIYWEPEGGRLATLYQMAKAYVSHDQPHFNPPVTVRL